MKTFEDMVRLGRKEKGLTQVELAKITGLTQATISDIESGRRKAQDKTIIKLLGALDMEDETIAIINPDNSSLRQVELIIRKYAGLSDRSKDLIVSMVKELGELDFLRDSKASTPFTSGVARQATLLGRR